MPPIAQAAGFADEAAYKAACLPESTRKDLRSVRVDSLFLDEGFGTLDVDTLDTALDTLDTLARSQQGGKIIGVISHVPALKDRISAQIAVEPISGGKSRLSGPGCSKG